MASTKLRRFLRKNPDAELDFSLSFKNPEVRVRDNGKFTLTWDSSDKHNWHSADGKSGKVSAKHLSRKRNWIKATGDINGMKRMYRHGDKFSLKDNTDHKIIGAMHGDSDDTLFLYESKRIKYKNGRSKMKGRLLSSDFVIDYAEELAYAYGEKAVRNHLLLERSLRKDDSSAFEILKGGISSKVTSDFWEDIRQMQKDAISKTKNNSIKNKYANAEGLSSREVVSLKKSFWDDATSWVDDTSKDAGKAIDDAANDAADFIEDSTQEIDQSTISPAQDIINDGIDEIDELLDPNGPIVLSNIVKWDLFSDRFEEAPFYAEYDATATATLEIHLEKGYLGALDASTISIHLIPNIDMSAGAGLELDPLVATYEGSIDGPERIFPNPETGQITISSRFDYNFTATASPGEGVGAGVSVKASPEAELSFRPILSNPDPKLVSIKSDFVFTEDVDRLFKNFNPSGELVATITPVVNVTALPLIPRDVPTVGGMGLGNIGVSYFNPIIFKYDTTDPKTLNGSVSGYIEPELSVLGQQIPGIPALDIYEKDFSFGFG